MDRPILPGRSSLPYQETLVGNQIYIVCALNLLMLRFILAGRYESWVAPLSILILVPFALHGTAAALLALGGPNSIYTQIGLILLIALASKNAIFAVLQRPEERVRGLSVGT